MAEPPDDSRNLGSRTGTPGPRQGRIAKNPTTAWTNCYGAANRAW